MSAAQRLYTPELLALAVELARWPRLVGATLSGEARSPTCGSTLTIDLELDEAGGVARIGMADRAYPARHGAMLLPWKAALAALSSTAPAG